MKSTIKFILFTFCCLLSLHALKAQNNSMEKKYIFELDITKSMWGLASESNLDIFDQVREQLIKAIREIQDPSSDIVLITWQDKIIDTWQQKATQKGKQELIDQLNAISAKTVPGQNTNIYNAWMEAKKHVDPNKINIIYLLTDGKHTVRNPPISKLYQEIPQWQDFSQDKDYYMFIVELTSEAIDQKLRSEVEKTDKVEFIHGIEFYTLYINQTNVVVNLDEQLEFPLSIQTQNLPKKYLDIKVKLNLENENFQIVNPPITLSDIPTTIKLRLLKPLDQVKASLPESSSFSIHLELEDNEHKHVKLINKIINCKIINKKEKVLYFKEL